MKILINATGSDQTDGFFSYITNIIPEICNNDNKNNYIIYSNGIIYDSLKEQKVPNLIFLGDLFNKSFIRFFWMQFSLPYILWKLKVNILLSPLNATPFVLKLTKIKSYLVIHSNLPWVYHQFLPYGSFKAGSLKLLKNLSLFCADYIITVSENAKKELVQQTGINADKTISILLGIDHENYNQNLNNSLSVLNYKYILYTANSALHHNHINLIKAYQLLRFEKNNHHKLLLIMSNLDTHGTNTIRNYISTNILERHIIILQSIAPEKLKGYYQNASVYVFPSLSETFGLTTIEAMACGVPVITSNCSSMPEINGDAALYFDPYNPCDIAEKINFVLQSEEQRTKMINKGLDRVTRYNWESTAKKMIDIFNEK